MRVLIFLCLMAQSFFAFSQQDNSVIFTGDRVLTNADSNNLWFLPKDAKIGGAVSFKSFMQDSTSGSMIIYPVTTVQFECGEWAADTVNQTNWAPADTSVNAPQPGLAPQWVYSNAEIIKRIPMVTGVKMCPCGCPPTDIYLHRRIDAASGAVETRQWIVRYTYRQNKTGFNRLLKVYEKKQ